MISAFKPADWSSGNLFVRMGRNIGWLLGGRGFQAVASLFYLGLAARTLGAQGFGDFTLALAYAQGIVNIVQFQSWQSVIRYGTSHLARGKGQRLDRLLGFTASLDLASAVAGALLGAAGVALIGPWLGWASAQQQQAALFAVALLLSIGATPTGMLRLYDRFDLVALAQAVGPAVRLAGAGAAWAAGGGIADFLAVWAGAAMVQSVATWVLAIRHAARRPALGRRRLALALRENDGIVRFMLTTNATSTLGALADHVGTLAVGGIAGAAAAGGYRLAAKLAKAMGRPVQLLTVVIFPELARLRHARAEGLSVRLAAQANRVGLLLASALVVVVALAGAPLLRLLTGIDYPGAGRLLFLFSLAAAADLSGFALEPLLTAHGRPQRVLAVRASGVALLLAAMALLLPWRGPEGAALAGVAAALVVRVRLGLAARREAVAARGGA